MTAAVTLAGIGHDYGATRALDGIDLAIAAGEYVALLGPSGCGKTTLLSVLGGFVHPTEGTVEIGGRDVTRMPPARRPTTTMFQDYALFPHMTVADNVAFGLRMRGAPRAARRARAAEMLGLVGLPEAAPRRPHALSGGQRQRIALARALAVSPDVLLLDEPLGALDLKLRRAMQGELKAIQRRVGTTFVHVTHDQEEAMAVADRIVVMNRGRIEDAGPPTRVYRRPASLFAADFMGETNHIPATAAGDGVDTPLGRLPVKPPAAGKLVACLRPEALTTGPRGVPLGRATLLDATFVGTHWRARVGVSALTLVAHLPPGAMPAPGTTIPLHADPDDVTVFEAP